MMMMAASTRAGGLSKRKPTKSGMVSESSAAVKSRRRGATQIHADVEKRTMRGAMRSQGAPHDHDCPEKPTKLLVLE